MITVVCYRVLVSDRDIKIRYEIAQINGIRGVVMAEQKMNEREKSTMDIRAHQKMFTSFVRFSTWVCALAGVVLVFLALSNA